MKWKHISEWERRQIYTLLREMYKQNEIATRLWRPPWTINKEISRNSVSGEYMPAYAQIMYEKRRSEINKGRSKIRDNKELQELIKTYLIEEKRGPDSISWRKKIWVCTQTIYTYIDQRAPSLKKYLKYKKGYKKRWTREKRGKPKTDFKLITERPKVVEKRRRIGDMEIDTIHNWWTKRKWWLVTIVDRKTKCVFWWKVRRRTAEEVWDVLIAQMSLLPKQKLLTITADNGKEFYDFERVESVLETPFYFANPYASYERWTNEQTNGMIRRFYPKWTDFSKIPEEEIQEVMRIINRKPRKSLGYLCAYEAFYWVKLNL